MQYKSYSELVGNKLNIGDSVIFGETIYIVDGDLDFSNWVYLKNISSRGDNDNIFKELGYNELQKNKIAKKIYNQSSVRGTFPESTNSNKFENLTKITLFLFLRLEGKNESYAFDIVFGREFKTKKIIMEKRENTYILDIYGGQIKVDLDNKEVLESIENKGEFYFDGVNYIYSEYEGTYIDKDKTVYTQDEGYISDRNYYYFAIDTDNYFADRDNVTYCETDGEYYEDGDILIYIDGSYYRNNDGDIVWCCDIEDYYFADDCYYNESSGDRYRHEENCENTNGLSQYHSSSSSDYSNNSQFRIGIEFEKDREADSNTIRELKEYGFRCEYDGSVNGGEYITPILDLYKAEDYLKGSPAVKEMIGLDISSNCGGHIHISEKGVSQEDFYNKIQYYRPIFWGLYPKRASATYCNKDSSESARYRDFSLNNSFGTVEIRIFPGVKSFNTIKFRLELLKFIVENPVYSREEAIKLLEEKQEQFISIIHIAHTSIAKKVETLKRILKYYEIEDQSIDNYISKTEEIYKTK